MVFNLTHLTGKFITLEGIDGAGKSCNLQWIKTLLEQAGKSVICTREPGGTEIGEEVRNILLKQRTGNMDAVTELLLLAAARNEHITKLIRPALARGDWVLCDRFSDATYAYQGGGRGLDSSILNKLEYLVQGDLSPNLTILLDVSVNTGGMRTQDRAISDRFDQETIDFFQRVRYAYLTRAQAEPQRIHVIDASLPLLQVQQSISGVIEKFLNLSRFEDPMD